MTGKQRLRSVKNQPGGTQVLGHNSEYLPTIVGAVVEKPNGTGHTGRGR